MSKKNTLILFTKTPIAGKVKTRLIPKLGIQGAYTLYCQFVKLMISRFSDLNGSQFVIYTDKIITPQHSIFQALPNTTEHVKEATKERIKEQRGKHLGSKMFNAMAQELHNHEESHDSSKANKVLLFGADCPFLNRDIIQEALESLDSNDLVFVPAMDGGYILIGATKIDRRIFENIQWSTSSVMAQTIKNTEQIGYSYQLLNKQHDIDEPSDLKLLKNRKEFNL